MTDIQKTQPKTVIYEVNLSVPKARQQELLTWLTPHINEMLSLPGFTGAHTLHQPSDEQSSENFRCTVHYYLESEQSVQNYLDNFAQKIREPGLQRFKNDLQATRRILRSHHALNIKLPDLPAITDETISNMDSPVTCMDCASSLQGKFCHTCGQRNQRRLVSVFSLVAEFFDGVFNWDSRFWRTLKPLLFKPGHLTEAYLNGQRERYIPPVRMYLITSVVFFVLIALAPQNAFQGDGDLTLGDLQVEIDGDEDSTSEGLQIEINRDDDSTIEDLPSESGQNGASTVESLQVEIDQNNDSKLESQPVAIEDNETAQATTEGFFTDLQIGTDDDKTPSLDPNTETEPADKGDESIADVSINDDTAQEKLNLHQLCEEILDEEFEINPESIRQPMYRICNSITTRSGARAFVREFFNDLPKTLFILLPLMALINKFFYPFSKRYYVEHLLYYVHNYSFLFLFGTILFIASTALNRIGIAWPEWISFVATLYAMYYFMKSMRVVYRQSRWATVLKWCGMMFIFTILSSVMVVGLAISAAALTA